MHLRLMQRLRHIRETVQQDVSELLIALRTIRPESWILLLLVPAALVLWTALAAHQPPAIFPSPLETAEAFFRMLGDYRLEYHNAFIATLRVYLAGLGLAVTVALALVFVSGLVPVLRGVMTPLFDLLGAVPGIAFMPLIVAFLGLGDSAKIVIVLIAAVVPITITAVAALRQIDPHYEETARDLGEGRIMAQLRVVWPLALPQMIAGLRIGALQGLTGVLIAEIYSAMTGLGGLLVGYGAAFNMARYLVVALTFAALGITITALLRKLERVLARRANLIT